MNKICFVIDSLRIGGAQKVTSDLAKLMSKHGFEVDFIIYNELYGIELSPDINLRKIFIPGLSRRGLLGFVDKVLTKIFGLPYRYMLSFFYSSILERKVDLSVYDKVFLCSDSGFVPFNLIKKNTIAIAHSLKSKQYLNSKFEFLNKLNYLIYKKILGQHEIVTVSKSIKKDLVNSFNLDSDRITVIYNYIDFDSINSKSLCGDLKLPYSYICHVGRHSPEKNISLLIDAFSLLEKDDLKLVLVGDGVESKKLKCKVSAMNLESRVDFLGFQKNPYPIIKNAKCLVLSSKREGLPTVLLESLCLNTKVVSTNCHSGPSEILTGSLSKYLVKEDDANALSKSIQQVLEDDHYDFHSNTDAFKDVSIVKKYKALISGVHEIVS
ncbi:glycosyltransferase [Vibrio parahaemolyticus]|nr:glycosyltransferase [Vibrio parahaemolyticus]MDF5537524.1 glycosyltransferase [Vibrio parahaemolyticus]MDF5561979.1 glycosyltransferase [Vibrio parahaemolyticus]MDG2602038.1 glycosyltransferase [Vibrio parahaemolyticus]MDG2852728.1 glycosyltransferase [Vibrio parahaemolyticus]